MDFTRQALQTNVKFFSNFGILFRISYIFLNNSGVGFVQAKRGRYLCRTACVLVKCFFFSNLKFVFEILAEN